MHQMDNKVQCTDLFNKGLGQQNMSPGDESEKKKQKMMYYRKP